MLRKNEFHITRLQSYLNGVNLPNFSIGYIMFNTSTNKYRYISASDANLAYCSRPLLITNPTQIDDFISQTQQTGLFNAMLISQPTRVKKNVSIIAEPKR